MLKIKDKDNGYRERLQAIASLGKKPKIFIGIFEGEGSSELPDGTRLIDVAVYNEFGFGVPERSFLRAWLAENEVKAKDVLAKLLQSAASGKKTEEQALNQFGLWVQGQIQARMAAGISPENAPSTVEKKGSSTPLIDTGQLRSAITFRIER